MAEEQASEAPQQSAKGGGGSGMIPALLVIVLMPIISFAMFKFMIIPMIKAELPEQGEAAPITAEDLNISYQESAEQIAYSFEPVIANVLGTSQTRFVQAVFTVYGKHPDFNALIEAKKVRLRDHADSVLGGLTLADLEKREIKNIVRNQLREGFNHHLGKPLVEEIYFDSFVTQ
ncbi:flagellar basal body-associated FliL family protein [Pelagicoccus sp. NFK12]|uniref:Flagellar protein FliL n=1 Tax=Pelagicoccus enzymogenes TaxID=2773457 RepID=A0A927F7N6_9BACT|nr:flagellar basal body-associated FliL family protein [Pelagicoccus enzymogenes]MBD5778670.1 flagellar basal body-associated FliL family protein [Pelagicoccus enzymogenes]MDQ8196958.1 flagellar basal body-associated FliL family protein [Pelagicoccus enzymogenes]